MNRRLFGLPLVLIIFVVAVLAPILLVDFTLVLPKLNNIDSQVKSLKNIRVEELIASPSPSASPSATPTKKLPAGKAR